jgi:hypothetical protein
MTKMKWVSSSVGEASESTFEREMDDEGLLDDSGADLLDADGR